MKSGSLGEGASGPPRRPAPQNCGDFFSLAKTQRRKGLRQTGKKLVSSSKMLYKQDARDKKREARKKSQRAVRFLCDFARTKKNLSQSREGAKVFPQRRIALRQSILVDHNFFAALRLCEKKKISLPPRPRRQADLQFCGTGNLTI